MFEARNVYECIHCGKTTDNMLSVGYCKEIEYKDGVVNVNNTPVVNMIDCLEVNIRHDTHMCVNVVKSPVELLNQSN